MQKSPLVAIDTNLPLLLAEGDDESLDALSVVRKRMRPAEILICPTVIEELRFHARSNADPGLRKLAASALINLRVRWQFRAVDMNSVQEALATEGAKRILHAGLLPSVERNDAAIIAESAVLNAVLLVSNDSHLLHVDHRRLGLLFREIELPVPLIVSPHEIIRKFYR